MVFRHLSMNLLLNDGIKNTLTTHPHSLDMESNERWPEPQQLSVGHLGNIFSQVEGTRDNQHNVGKSQSFHLYQSL